MASTEFHIKQDDRNPSLTATLVDENEAAVDLTNATGVTFHMINPGSGTVKVDGGSVVIINPPGVDGRVRYDWQAGDTDEAGDFDGEFEVTWTGGTKTTFPNHRFIRIKITKDISD